MDAYEGPVEVAPEVDPELVAPEELVDRIRLWGSRARLAISTLQGVRAAVERELARLYPELESAELPAEETLLEPMRDEMRQGFVDYIRALEMLREALQSADAGLLDSALEGAEEAEERLRRLDEQYAEAESAASADEADVNSL